MYTARSGPVELNQTLEDDQSEPSPLRFVSALRTEHMSDHAHYRTTIGDHEGSGPMHGPQPAPTQKAQTQKRIKNINTKGTNSTTNPKTMTMLTVNEISSRLESGRHLGLHRIRLFRPPIYPPKSEDKLCNE